MKKIDVKASSIHGASSNACQITTAVFCMSSIYLLYTPWAPVAAATGIGCALGAYAGCAPAH